MEKVNIDVLVMKKDIDECNHAKYSAHLEWYKLGHQAFLESAESSFEVLNKDYHINPMVRHVNVDYLAQIFEGDNLCIETEICNLGRTSLTYSQSIKCDNTTKSTAKITVVFTNFDGKPVKIPDDIRARLF